jgi:transcription antitermination factor NusG
MAAPGSDLGAIGSGGAFSGFMQADFNAYEPKKHASNAYTLERRRAKDKLLALVRAVQKELEEELAGLELGASDEMPTVANGRKVECQWAFFTRGADDRSSIRTLLHRTDLAGGAELFDIAIQHQHACIMLRLDQSGLAISFDLATKARVDRDNAAEKLKQTWAKDKLVELCRALPGDAKIGLKNDLKDPLAITASDVQAWIELLEKSEQPFLAEVFIEKSEEILASPGLIATVAEHVSQFVPIYRFLAWSRDNDQRQVKSAVKQEMADRQKKAVTFEAGDRVTILSGLFAGRSGYLAEIDGKGRAKVMVGPVSVTVDAKDLKAS